MVHLWMGVSKHQSELEILRVREKVQLISGEMVTAVEGKLFKCISFPYSDYLKE